jgi:hypothetical protein
MCGPSPGLSPREEWRERHKIMCREGTGRFKSRRERSGPWEEQAWARMLQISDLTFEVVKFELVRD